MAVKAIEMIRKIRDKHYEQTKSLSVKKQIEFIRKRAEKLQKRLKIGQRSTSDNTAQTIKV